MFITNTSGKRIRCATWLAASVLAAALSAAGAADVAPAPDSGKSAAAAAPLRILFVGNSYTSVNNLPAMVQQLAAADKALRPIAFTAATPGGCSFQRHVDEEKFGTQKAIAAAAWDYVVLQEQSQMPFAFPKTTIDYGKKLGAWIKEKNARPLLYATWARENQPENQAKIAQTYETLAREIDAAVAPVGAAWEAARKRNGDLKLYMKDQSHPSPAGTYLAACVFHSVIHGKSPAGLPRKLAITDKGKEQLLVELPEKDATLLQQVAWETVEAARKKP